MDESIQLGRIDIWQSASRKNPVQAYKDRELEQYQDEPGKRVYASLFVEGKYGFTLFFSIVFVFSFELFYFGRYVFHGHLRCNRPFREREKDEPDNDRQNDDGDPDIMRWNKPYQENQSIIERFVDYRVEDAADHDWLL
jgi:hypothetical protein